MSNRLPTKSYAEQLLRDGEIIEVSSESITLYMRKGFFTLNHVERSMKDMVAWLEDRGEDESHG